MRVPTTRGKERSLNLVVCRIFLHETTDEDGSMKTRTKAQTHVVRALHLLEVGPVLLRHLLPPLIELVRVHLEGLRPVGSLDLRRGRALVYVQERVELISACGKKRHGQGCGRGAKHGRRNV